MNQSKKKKRSRVSKSCNRAKIAGHKEQMTLKQLSDAFGSVTMTEAASELTEANSLISSSSFDRISELPQPILQHILCFLSQDEAAQTCLLSKSWRHHWCGRPILEFCKNLFRCNSETFLTNMDQTLERYHRQNFSIKRFVVEISSSVGDDELILLLEKWIPIVLINMNVETLRLEFAAHTYYSFALPSAPLPLVFLKELYLKGCKVTYAADHNHNLCLKHLQTLSLIRVYIVDEALEKIMTGSPLMERLKLNWCDGLTNVKVNHNLKHFECLESSRNIEIKVPSSLETIRVDSTRCLNCYHINNHRFHSLKSLCLSDVQLSEELSNTFSCNSPCLEDLKLINCSGFNNVKILSRSVKRLTIVDTKAQNKNITIDAPGIVYFCLSCRSSLPSISLATVVPREWESNINVTFDFELESYGIVMLNEVLRTLRQSRITLTLFWYVTRAQLFEDINYAGCHEPVVVEHLNLELFDLDYDDDDDFAALFNCLFRIFRPRYIYIKMYHRPNTSMHSHIDNITKFIWKTSLEDGEFSRCYPWQQDLKESRCYLLDKYSGQWQPVFELMEIQRNETIRFGFEWRESWPCLCG